MKSQIYPNFPGDEYKSSGPELNSIWFWNHMVCHKRVCMNSKHKNETGRKTKYQNWADFFPRARSRYFITWTLQVQIIEVQSGFKPLILISIIQLSDDAFPANCFVHACVFLLRMKGNKKHELFTDKIR